jgi:phenylacetate-CoA ligase
MVGQPKELPRGLRNAARLSQQLKTKPESYWQKRGERMALKLFHDMSRGVPAYKDFLKVNGVNPATIKTIDDFKQVPTIDKDNYLRHYPRQDLCWNGEFSSKQWVVSTTSGSTGEPFYFPRTGLQDDIYALTAELYLRENFQIHKKSTLYIDAFAMGAWIGGLFTYEAIHKVAQKGYALSIITPGINKNEVISSVRQLGGDFDQVIIGCYPPIMRDIIDYGIEEGINWQDYSLGIIFSAEGFGEEFRDYIHRHAKLANIHTSTLNHYGTVDLGTMSHETALSILIRRQAVQEKQLFDSIFGDISKQPTLTQYLPELFYFEADADRVICSSYSGLPLVRYDLKDNGGVLSLESIRNSYVVNKLNLDNEAAYADIKDKHWNLPFVYIYERSDFSVTFTGAQIYPEEIRRALLNPALHEFVTGKFTMIAGYDEKAQNFLELHIEMRKKVDSSAELSAKIQKIVIDHLLKENSEYRVLYGDYKEKLHPRINLWEHEHKLHFEGKGKQKWLKEPEF